MGMEGVFAVSTGTLQKFMKFKYDDDFLDRVNRIYTCLLFIIFSAVLSTSSYVGKALECWAQPYGGMRDDYIETMCWIKNTYFLPLQDQIPNEIPDRRDRELNYYQWVPMFLLLQALMFHVPSFFWRALNRESGINITAIMSTAVEKRSFDPEERKKNMVFLGKHIDRCLEFQRTYKSGRWYAIKQKVSSLLGCVCGKRQGNFLFTIYIITKILYMTNLWSQLVILNYFLGTEYYMYGIDLGMDIMLGRTWQDTGRFPRVTMCDFQVRVLGNLHRFTVQCVLPVNLFNEKVYIFIWFWIFFLGIFTSIGFFMWLKRMIIPMARVGYVKKYLKLLNTLPDRNDPLYIEEKYKQRIHKFVHQYLRIDGVFILHLLAKNTSDLLTAELVQELWDQFNDKKDNQLHITSSGLYPNANGGNDYDPDTIPLRKRDTTRPGEQV